MKHNLLLFSGGLDSTYIAYKLLSETRDKLTLVIVSSNDGKAEGLNSKSILNIQSILHELSLIRSFNVEYLYADAKEITSHDLDRWNIYPMFKYSNDFNSGKYDNFICGTSWEQMDGAFLKHSSLRGFPRIHDGNKYFKSVTTKGNIWNPLITHDFHNNYNRWHVVKYLPENLMRKTITCSSGEIEENRCNKCEKCALNNKTREMIAGGATASDFDDWRRAKSLEYGGGKRDSGTQRWISLEVFGPISTPRKGLAEDVDPNLKLPNVISNKEDFLLWYSTIEYVPGFDYRLMKWNLKKDYWDPNQFIE